MKNADGSKTFLQVCSAAPQSQCHLGEETPARDVPMERYQLVGFLPTNRHYVTESQRILQKK